MNVFSKKWIKYQYLIRTTAYKHQAIERESGVDFSNFDLFKDFEQNYIFIHIPKAAGLSVVKALTGHTISHHALAIDYKKQNQNLFDSSYKFSVARNPIDRCLSAYNYLQSGGRLNIYDCFWRERYIKNYNSFDSFIQEGGLSEAISNNAEHFIPQWNYLSENDKCIVDDIGKLEDIQLFMQNVSKRLGRKINIEKINSANYMKGKNVSNQSIFMISDIYKNDFEKLGY